MSLAKRGPTSGKPINPTPAQEERFWGHVDIRADNECWQWMGYINPNGYGAVNVGGSIRPAHRVAYAISKGPLIPGLEIDHLCRNRGCCNPAHLEQVTRGENIRRSDLNAEKKRRTHCPHGHEYTPENTLREVGRQGRRCRECKRIGTREYMRRTAPQRNAARRQARAAAASRKETKQ
jgi:hypothetical protein